MDPVATRLFLGRFLSRDLVSMPDIDLDFPRDVREGLMLAVVERYGAERAALVAAFPTYRTRGAIRDLGKALALPQGEVERMARLADAWGEMAPEAIDELRGRLDSPRWRAFRFLMEEIRGLPRHLSQHSGRHDHLHRSAGRAGAGDPGRHARAARSASGTRTPAPTPASSRSTCWAWACCRRSRSAWI